MAQLSDIQSFDSLRGIAADYKPISRPAEFVTEVFSAASHSNYGKVLHVKQAWLDLVSSLCDTLMICVI